MKTNMLSLGRTEVPNEELRVRIIELLEATLGQSVKELATELEVNRIFLSGYLQALEHEGLLFSRKLGPARIYYNKRKRGR